MKIVLQKVSQASVVVDSKVISRYVTGFFSFVSAPIFLTNSSIYVTVLNMVICS